MKILAKSKAGLTYTISEKHFVAVVSFHGPLLGCHRDVIKKCEADLALRNINWAILNFQEITEVQFDVGPELLKLQSALRNKVVGLRLCSLNLRAKALLQEAVLIRPGEVYRNLTDAMNSLPKSRALDVGSV